MLYPHIYHNIGHIPFQWVYLAGYDNEYRNLQNFWYLEKSHRQGTVSAPWWPPSKRTVRSDTLCDVITPLSWAAGLPLAGGDVSLPACRAVIRNLIDTWRMMPPGRVEGDSDPRPCTGIRHFLLRSFPWPDLRSNFEVDLSWSRDDQNRSCRICVDASWWDRLFYTIPTS